MHEFRFFAPAAMFEKNNRFAVFLHNVEMDARVDRLVRAPKALPPHPLRRGYLQNFKWKSGPVGCAPLPKEKGEAISGYTSPLSLGSRLLSGFSLTSLNEAPACSPQCPRTAR